MIKALLHLAATPHALLEHVRTLDMQAVVECAWQHFNQRKNSLPQGQRDRLLASVATAAGNRLSFDLGHGVALDIARVERVAEHLYSTSGHCVWFAPAGLSYSLCVYRRVGDQVADPQWVVVDQQAPLLIHGDEHVVSLNPREAPEHLAFSLSVPAAGSDIAVYGRESLARIAWFPADAQVARFMVLLQALQTIGDPCLLPVAGELIYHPHSALRWLAFQILMEHSPQRRDEYCALLRATGDAGLDQLVAGYPGVVRA